MVGLQSDPCAQSDGSSNYFLITATNNYLAGLSVVIPSLTRASGPHSLTLTTGLSTPSYTVGPIQWSVFTQSYYAMHNTNGSVLTPSILPSVSFAPQSWCNRVDLGSGFVSSPSYAAVSFTTAGGIPATGAIGMLCVCCVLISHGAVAVLTYPIGFTVGNQLPSSYTGLTVPTTLSATVVGQKVIITGFSLVSPSTTVTLTFGTPNANSAHNPPGTGTTGSCTAAVC